MRTWNKPQILNTYVFFINCIQFWLSLLKKWGPIHYITQVTLNCTTLHRKNTLLVSCMLHGLILHFSLNLEKHTFRESALSGMTTWLLEVVWENWTTIQALLKRENFSLVITFSTTITSLGKLLLFITSSSVRSCTCFLSLSVLARLSKMGFVRTEVTNILSNYQDN